MPTASSPAPGDLTRRTGCQALEFDPEVAYSDEVVRAAGLYADDELLLDHSGCLCQLDPCKMQLVCAHICNLHMPTKGSFVGARPATLAQPHM